MKRNAVIRTLFAIGLAAYPFIIYFGLGVLPPSFFALALALLLLARLGILTPSNRRMVTPVLAIFLAYAVAAAIWRSAAMLLYYPALVNFCFCAVFVISLWRKEPLLLRLVQARGEQMNPYAPRYLQRLTALWAVFFAANGAVSIWTSTVSMEAWAIYNGLISYIIIALLIGGEWLFRKRYKRRMGVRDS